MERTPTLLTREQRVRIFAGEPDAESSNGTPDCPWYVHPAMPWEDVKAHFTGVLSDRMVPVNERPRGLRAVEYTAEREVFWRMKLLQNWTDAALRRRCAELSETNMRLQKRVAELESRE